MDETLETILGTTIKEVIYEYIRLEHNLDVETCCKSPKEFMEALSEIVGCNAAMIIENVVIRKLRSRFGVKGLNEDSHLSDLIERLKILSREGPAKIEKKV